MKLFVAVLLLLTLSCAGDQIDRAEWQSMTPEARLLFVRALLGEEQANAAKGGQARRYPHSPETYVARIDEAYAKGEQRDAAQVFAGLAEK